MTIGTVTVWTVCYKRRYKRIKYEEAAGTEEEEDEDRALLGGKKTVDTGAAAEGMDTKLAEATVVEATDTKPDEQEVKKEPEESI